MDRYALTEKEKHRTKRKVRNQQQQCNIMMKVMETNLRHNMGQHLY